MPYVHYNVANPEDVKQMPFINRAPDGSVTSREQYYYMPRMMRDAFKAILDNATSEEAEPYPQATNHMSGEDWTELYKQREAWRERNKYKGFFSPGYRNNDTLNSMLAWYVVKQNCGGYEHGEPVLDSDNPPFFDYGGWADWARSVCAESDWDAVEAKSQVIMEYIDNYVKQPTEYIQNTDYIEFPKWSYVDEDAKHVQKVVAPRWELVYNPITPYWRRYTKRKKVS